MGRASRRWRMSASRPHPPSFRSAFDETSRKQTSERLRGRLRQASDAHALREGDKLIKLPAIQAVLRSKVALAAKGNGPAQRALFAIARAIESELAVQN